jgi:hypothetical protein
MEKKIEVTCECPLSRAPQGHYGQFARTQIAEWPRRESGKAAGAREIGPLPAEAKRPYDRMV